jgi:hypothetical protein
MFSLTIRLVLLPVIFSTLPVSVLSCNGNRDYCDLRIDQFTFAGAHNAGTALTGTMKFRGSIFPALHCTYRNQEGNFEELLDEGIRFLDVDTCYSKGKISSCHGGAWGGYLEDGLDQLEEWMNDHENDLVIIHFNWDTDDDDQNRIATGIKDMLEDRFTGSGCGMNTYYNTHNQNWPTLKDAIDSNKRLFVFMAYGLAEQISYPDWVFPTTRSTKNSYYYNYRPAITPGESPHSSNCDSIPETVRTICADSSVIMVDVSVYGKWGSCIGSMASSCAPYILKSTDNCYQERKKSGKTVNIITTDYSTRDGDQYLPAVADNMNQKNVQDFLR